jgi:hypothetical protein
MNLGSKFWVVWIVVVLLCGSIYRKVIAKNFDYPLNYRFKSGEFFLWGIEFKQIDVIRI